ncbi:hypothetical protein AOLI_G00297620 [Acnodon oligacanthus]
MSSAPALNIMDGTHVAWNTQGHQARFERSPTRARPIPRIRPAHHGWYSRNAVGMGAIRHHVENKEELDLLLAYATGRFKCHLNCTICDKKHLFWLDRHLTNLCNISRRELGRMLIAAKEERLVRKLAELRVRAPEPPMVSELDLGVTVTSSCSVEPDEGEESHCSDPEPATQADSSEPESREAEASPAAPEASVLIHLTLPNQEDDQNWAAILVDQHKTDRAYRIAFMALLQRKVLRLRGLMEVSEHFGGDQNPVVPEIQNVFRVRDLCMKAMEQESMELGSHPSDTEHPEPYLDADTDTDT